MTHDPQTKVSPPAPDPIARADAGEPAGRR